MNSVQKSFLQAMCVCTLVGKASPHKPFPYSPGYPCSPLKKPSVALAEIGLDVRRHCREGKEREREMEKLVLFVTSSCCC